MNTRNHFCTHLMLGASLLAVSQLAWSLGLGEAQVESFLGQPLEVKIELITGPTDDLTSVSAGLASAADYELIGASRDDISVPLQFWVESGDGNAYITVSSTLAINNPVVRLILEINWSSGRMLREYTLFLDPATFSQPAPAPRIEAPSTAPAPRIEAASTTPAPRIEAAPTTPAQAAPAPRSEIEKTVAAPPAATPVDDVIISGTDEYGPVETGDTLWRIAKDWSDGTGLNLNQVMLAIQRQNPRAFSRNNINLLRRGTILRMPQRDEINAISVAAATREVTEQIDLFRSPQNQVPAAAVPLIAEESVAIEPAQSETPLAEPLAGDTSPRSESPADSAPSQLELLPPSADNSINSTSGFEQSQTSVDDAATAQELREELFRKEEELFNQQQQNTYLEQRLLELESQLTESREGSVEDKNLASMEERLRQERLDKAKTAVPKVVSPPPPEEPWYRRFSIWLLGLLVLVAAGVGWLMSRRGSSDTVVSDLGGRSDPLREITDKAKDAVRDLDAMAEQKVAEEEGKEEVTATEPEAPAAGGPEDTQTMPASVKHSEQDEEAQLLDQESTDPEIQLDLARAYISMGDKEAARIILEEVNDHGSEQQQAEAKKMKDML